jgi:septal ring factor EnvC (AmiA/AmiB activator)
MIRIVTYFIFLYAIASWAQDQVDQQLQKNRSSLDRVKEEISTLKKEIKRADIKSSSTLDQIKSIDRELSLISKAKRLLNNEISLLNEKIQSTHTKLEDRRNRLNNLRTQYQKRVVQMYKRGRVQDLVLLLESESINQSLVRMKYYRFFADQEKHLIYSIKNEMEEIQNLEQELAVHRSELENSVADKNQQENDYLARKSEKKVLINKILWDRQNLQKQLTDAEAEYEKLYQIILALERQRRDSEKTGRPDRSFALNTKEFKKNKGKLPWPVDGKILHAYGKQRNDRLKTTINNTGIDIRADLGTKVHAVFTGIVSMITYLSGFGNTIIIDHGEGYYSVYSHLDDILVNVDQLVEMGEIIGLVGDSGSLEGAKLHFALFANQQTENPQSWLR